jgi:hypothetical protein
MSFIFRFLTIDSTQNFKIVLLIPLMQPVRWHLQKVELFFNFFKHWNFPSRYKIPSQSIQIYYMMMRLFKIDLFGFWISLLHFVAHGDFNTCLSVYHLSDYIHTLFLQNLSTFWAFLISFSCFHHPDLDQKCHWTWSQTSTPGHCHGVHLKHIDCLLQLAL